jgi:SAM-dependent methyltransferase
VRDDERRRRRDTFERNAVDYDTVRPGYPAEALAAAASLASLGEGVRALEVGCGTGQATAWLGSLGCEVLALDRAPDMLEAARRRLSAYPNVELRLADFEALSVRPSYGALLFATSYHWLDPSDRVDRCAGHLARGGSLVLLWHTHPRPYTGFHERVESIYRRLVPDWEPPASPGMTEEGIDRVRSELERGRGPFGPVVRRSFDWSRVYSRADYVRLLSTYSDHLLMPDALRRELFADVGALADREFGGAIERPYRTELLVAAKR